MLPLVIEHADPTTGWDIATAVGTVAAAIATAAAVIVALVTGARDRRAADRAIVQQLEDARVRQAADHAELRDRQAVEHAELRGRQAQEHEIDLLTSLAGAVSDAVAHDLSAVGSGALVRGRAIALALPAVKEMPAVRLFLSLGDRDTQESYREAYGRPYHPSQGPNHASAEIAHRITQVADE